MTMWVVMLLVIGTGLGFLRFVLDDKWNVLPKSLCRFCATWWAALALTIVAALILLFLEFAPLLAVLMILGAFPATVLACISYVYIKNAN